MLKQCVFVAGLLPFILAIQQIWMLQTGGTHDLGADPARELVLAQGETAIRFLLLTLVITPLRRLTGWAKLGSIRRMLGLFTFFYASLHVLIYGLFLLEFDLVALAEELTERPFITVGFLAWLLLLPLALTSTARMARRLGRSWRSLHRLIYIAALLVVIHIFWLAKSNYLEPIIYGGALLLLLFFRLLSLKVHLPRLKGK